jgi:hypothetical protein
LNKEWNNDFTELNGLKFVPFNMDEGTKILFGDQPVLLTPIVETEQVSKMLFFNSTLTWLFI